MRVTMIEDRQAAPDGSTVVSLIAGESYTLPDDLAERYIARGLARPEGAEHAPTAKGPAPEDKALVGPPEDKRRRMPAKKTTAARRAD